jgi:hypothetical protein
MTWQPIETAPRDGTEFQAWMMRDDDGSSHWEPMVRFNPETDAFELWGRIDYDIDGWDTYYWLVPTHWMPQPEPPK